MSEYLAQPLSRRELRAFAAVMRATFHVEDITYIPITRILEVLPSIVPGANFEIVEPEELEEDEHAATDVTTRTIKIRVDVYDRACAGCGRDRMTIAHEIAHLFLICVYGVRLSRAFIPRGQRIPAYRDPEWQAKCLAGEFMMDAEKVRGMDAFTVVESCGVSLDAAQMQLSKI